MAIFLLGMGALVGSGVCACTITGGPYVDHPEVHNGAAGIVPVDLFIPDRSRHPLTILDGVLRLKVSHA